MRFQSITYGIMPSIIETKEKEEGALAACTQQIHLRVKGTICTSFFITSQAATSFEDLKISPDSVLLSTFKETAIAYGLLKSDVEWDNCLSEASISFMPKQLRSLFVTILIFGQPSKPLDLWEKYKDVMGEDIS